MPLICQTNDIKYTLVRGLTEEDFEDILEGSAEHDNYEGIVGFIRNGKFTHPHDVEEQYETLWSKEFCQAFPDECILVIVGAPLFVDSILERYINMENDWYNQHNVYDLWQTPVGYIAVC